MQKLALNKSAVRTPFALDADQVLEEIASSSIQFLGMKLARRGPTHKSVEAAYLKATPETFRTDLEGSPADLLHSVPTLKSFIEAVPGKVGRMLLARLDGHSCIKLHEDRNNPYFSETLRFHIPLVTNDRVWFFNTGKLYQMKKGELWCINNLGTHGVVNDSDKKRLHVIFDVFIDDKIVELVQSAEENLGIDIGSKPHIVAIFPKAAAGNY